MTENQKKFLTNFTKTQSKLVDSRLNQTVQISDTIPNANTVYDRSDNK